MKALSIHMQKPYKEKIVYVLTAVLCQKCSFFNQTPSMFSVSTLYKQSVKLFHQKLW